IVTPEAGMIRSPAHVFDSAQADRWSEFIDTEMAPLLRQFGVHWLGVFAEPSLEDLSLSKGRIPLHIPSAYLFNGFGDAVDRVPKASLIPFIEAIPYTEYLGGLRSLFPWAGSRSDLIDRSVIQLHGYKIGAQICYDSLFGKNFQRLQREGADLNLVLTNDFLLSEPGAWIHHYLTRVRALEFGIPTYFVGNAGFTGWVDSPQGQWNKREFFAFDFRAQPAATIYSRFVNHWLEPTLEWSTGALFLVLFVFLALDVFRRRVALIQAGTRLIRKDAFRGIVLGGIAIAIVNFYVVQVIFVPSRSMEPLLRPGDRALICKFKRAQRGDVISFLEVFSGSQLIKRVFLQPGDHYQWRDGKPILNGQEVVFQAVPDQKSDFLIFEIQVPGGKPYRVQVRDQNALWPKTNLQMQESEFFVLGDARDQSVDSRSYGPLEESNISGVMCWP
ncbi:MAG: signal peptidase I, partial [Bdellovibrionales bacterium]|nr:signal peptidase I [Bdellovibrionales bacterium]